ncbi:GcrA family cell cycle regulator [Anderseniella sp. Alg231-50]|uniref:GcrA family cell cycle regulator n=1 Tax=Anderseniella sp. Alg231-50 TaxID=1922226 RepID=UPI000D55D090
MTAGKPPANVANAANAKPSKWTPEKVEQVRRLTAAGHTSRQIGAMMGSTRNAIVSVWRRFGIEPVMKRNTWDEAAITRVVQLLDERWAYTEIAAEFGVTLGTIGNVVTRHGLRPRKPKPGRFAIKAPDFDADAVFDRSPFKPMFAEGFAGQAGKLAMADLEDHHCRFPVDQPDGTVKFCADTQQHGSPYCPAHHERCCGGPAITFKKRA